MNDGSAGWPASLRPSVAFPTIWAHVALAHARRIARSADLHRRRVLSSLLLRASARPIVVEVLNRRGASCVQRSLVLQAFDFDHGHNRDMVVGVHGDRPDKLQVYAWLDGDEPEPRTRREITVLYRRTHPVA